MTWNGWAALVALGVLARVALDVTADVLNLRALPRDVPVALRDAYDPARWRRARDYLRAQTRFGLVPAVVQPLALVAFWLAGGFAALDAAVRSVALPPVPAGLVYVGALALGAALLGLPFRWWSTFVVEERFGFNRTTPRTFWSDVAKGAALAVVLGGTLLAAILWLFDTAGARAWLWAWLAAAAFTVVVQLVAPTWLLPLFNRFTPLPPGALRDAVVAYARAVRFPLEEVFVVDGSRRSTKANAFFTGFGRRKRIALYDTLIARHPPDEVIAVLAHEVGHWARRHVTKGLVLGIAEMGLLLFLLSALVDRPGLHAAFGVREPTLHGGLVFASFALAPLQLALGLGGLAIARRHEREADAFAVGTTGTGGPLADALARLAADGLANPTPHPLYVLVHHSHPPLLDRIRALRTASPG